MDLAGTALTIIAVVVAMIPLAAMTVFVLARGASAINLAFFTTGPGVLYGGGMLPMIVGTLILIGLASGLGIPLGFLIGLYLARNATGRLGRVVRFVSDVIAGTPSILAGVIAFSLVVIPTGTFSAYSAAVALALLMFPTVGRATEAALRAVPVELREAALALGANEWKVMLQIVTPTAASGIVTAMVLGVARVAGETAPLIFTAGGNPAFTTNIFGPIGSMPQQIFIDAQSVYPQDHQTAFAGALVLFAIVLLLNLLARGMTLSLSRRMKLA